MRRFRGILLLLCAATLLWSCGDIKNVNNIKLSSCGVKYITPTSLRSMTGVLLLEIDNPSFNFTVSDVEGCVKFSDRKMLLFTAGEVPVQRHSIQVYELPCTVTLAEGASLLDILIVASKGNLKGLKADVDVQAALKKNGVLRAPFRFRDLDLQELSQQ